MKYQAPLAELIFLSEDALMASSGSAGSGSGTTDPDTGSGSDTDDGIPSLPPDYFD